MGLVFMNSYCTKLSPNTKPWTVSAGRGLNAEGQAPGPGVYYLNIKRVGWSGVSQPGHWTFWVRWFFTVRGEELPAPCSTPDHNPLEANGTCPGVTKMFPAVAKGAPGSSSGLGVRSMGFEAEVSSTGLAWSPSSQPGPGQGWMEGPRDRFPQRAGAAPGLTEPPQASWWSEGPHFCPLPSPVLPL